MDIRKIQRSGTTYYIYLPASWCRQNNITTKTMVYLERTPEGGLVINVGDRVSQLPSLNLILNDSSPEVINNMIIASYINPVKSFDIKLKETVKSDQVLMHQKIFRGLDFLEFQDNNIFCHTTLTVEEPDVLLNSIIKKILSIVRLRLQDGSPELIEKYEEEIDKSNLLIKKSIIASLMYKKTFKLRQIDLYYIGMLSRALERFTDILQHMKKDEILLNQILTVMRKLEEIMPNVEQTRVVGFIKLVSKIEKKEIIDTDSFEQERLIALLEHIGEIVSDWMITNKIEQ